MKGLGQYAHKHLGTVFVTLDCLEKQATLESKDISVFVDYKGDIQLVYEKDLI
jgi:hypothetical protein